MRLLIFSYAVVVSGSNIVAMQGQSEVTMGELDSTNAEQSNSAADDETDFQEPDYYNISIARLSAIVNPQPEDEKRAEDEKWYGYKFPNDRQCMMIPGGKSHLP
jgi:hypothetical protein